MGESRACQDFDAKGFISIVEKFVVYVADFFDTLSVIKGLIEFVLGLCIWQNLCFGQFIIQELQCLCYSHNILVRHIRAVHS